MTSFNRIPLNLPHAGTLAERIRRLLPLPEEDRREEFEKVFRLSRELEDLLTPYRVYEENPQPEVAEKICVQAAAFGRMVVLEIERLKIGHDRLGQFVRNFFECLELGEEGAEISLRAGEDPNSTLRP